MRAVGPSAARSYFNVTGAVVQAPIQCVITAVNEAGAPLTTGGANFTVTFIPPAPAAPIQVPATDAQNGTYTAQWAPTTAGLWGVSVALVTAGTPAQVGSTVTVNITPAVTGTASPPMIHSWLELMVWWWWLQERVRPAVSLT